MAIELAPTCVPPALKPALADVPNAMELILIALEPLPIAIEREPDEYAPVYDVPSPSPLVRELPIDIDPLP